MPRWVEDEYGAVFADVASIVVENIHQKRDEFIYAEAHPEFEVSRLTTGADLVHRETGEKRELKVARVTRADAQVNFQFSFTAQRRGETLVQFRTRIADGMEAKIGPGIAAFIAKDGLGRVKKEYEISGEFLRNYVNTLPGLKASTVKINLGAPLCRDCGECHRVKKLADLSKKDWLELTAEESESVHARTPTHCGNPPAVEAEQQ